MGVVVRKQMLALALLQALLVSVATAATTGSLRSDSGSGSVHEDENKTATHIFKSASDVKVGPGIVAAGAIVVGLVVCLAGYKLFRPTMFACGFVTGGVFLAGVAEAMFKSQTWMATASWIAFFLGGIALGSLVLYLYSAGIFLGGAAAGVLLAFTLNTSVGPKLYPHNPDVVLVILSVLLGIIGGIAAIKIERPVLIVATSFVGSELFIAGVGYFAGNFPTSTDFDTFKKELDDDGEWVYEIPDAWWGYVCGMLALFILGMVVQFKKTAHGHDHSKSRAMPSKDAVQAGNPVSHV
jgi:hypothetical protein|uniref:Transmembrane protein 198 n=1 Tax=Globisporangium ultimum (strain ATCC 200006 / CBS 805.95 / DAOM BR144) TaxID=431595 RepID=K3WBU8_GLOUD